MIKTIRYISGLPIRWQIITLLLLTQITAHIVTIIYINDSFGFGLDTRTVAAREIVGPIATIVNLVSVMDGPIRDRTLQNALSFDARFTIEAALETSKTMPQSGTASLLLRALSEQLPGKKISDLAVLSGGMGITSPFGGDYVLATRLSDARWLVFHPGKQSLLRVVPQLVAFLTVLVLTLPLTAFAVWSGRVLSRPIAKLADSASAFSIDLDAPEIPEEGAQEVRRATSAFNEMRGQIRKLVHTRSLTLAAIGHDLRTPLTRLRLRAEALDDKDGRDDQLSDILMMERMIDSALSFLRGQNRKLRKDRVDIADLIQAKVDEALDVGVPVQYKGPRRYVLRCDAELLVRALDNLVTNASTYATHILVTLDVESDHECKILVEDNGPGIPRHKWSAMLEPFETGDVERSFEKRSGFGLGLAIVREIVERHGGTITLGQAVPQGLLVTLTFPALAVETKQEKAPLDSSVGAT